QTDALTLEGHAEGGERIALGGLGFDRGIGMFGELGVAATQSPLAGASGRQYAYGYSYATQRFSVSLQRIQRTNAFRDLSEYDQPANVAYRLER
ncbi:fimbrial biogenesis outer membrane usher protein, partial [Burkholderia pseudomallei]